MAKKSIVIQSESQTSRISWYDGSTDDCIKKLIEDAFGLPPKCRFLLIDPSDDSVVAISSSLPVKKRKILKSKKKIPRIAGLKGRRFKENCLNLNESTPIWQMRELG
eukprot:CAMPEP_0117869984 /NCGR_PEP_ID=MMETSP0950-20121206/9570_1 /TAXON_ID=44440 /ORGANISM="Chattonella subsalsa, Strain CCMP2191" /LENGTH=106 /DNA_ID=CAMNT_0005722185 /DNA_START=24 /DNA_END=344 /DNA_ORIENTATION=-